MVRNRRIAPCVELGRVRNGEIRVASRRWCGYARTAGSALNMWSIEDRLECYDGQALLQGIQQTLTACMRREMPKCYADATPDDGRRIEWYCSHGVTVRLTGAAVMASFCSCCQRMPVHPWHLR